MSKRTPAISVLTANRLHDGIVVFLDANGAWVQAIDSAAVARSPEQAEAFQALGARDAAANLVVEPYLAEVRETGGRLVPVRFRERVRVEGPSILGDVPGYVAPSPRASSPSPRLRGEGRGEGQPHTPDGVRRLASSLGANLKHRGEGSDPVAAPLPALTERVEGSAMRGERESAEAA